MKPSLPHAVAFVLLAQQTLASPPSLVANLPRDGTPDDELNDWLATAQRVSPDLLKPCPVSCSSVSDSSGWFLFPDASRLASCNETMLFSTVVQTTATSSEDGNDDTHHPAIKACTADYEPVMKLAFVPDDGKSALCTTANRVLEKTSLSLHQLQAVNADEFSANHLIDAASQVGRHLASKKPSCTNNAIEFAYPRPAPYPPHPCFNFCCPGHRHPLHSQGRSRQRHELLPVAVQHQGRCLILWIWLMTSAPGCYGLCLRDCRGG